MSVAHSSDLSVAFSSVHVSQVSVPGASESSVADPPVEPLVELLVELLFDLLPPFDTEPDFSAPRLFTSSELHAVNEPATTAQATTTVVRKRFEGCIRAQYR